MNVIETCIVCVYETFTVTNIVLLNHEDSLKLNKVACGSNIERFPPNAQLITRPTDSQDVNKLQEHISSQQA